MDINFGKQNKRGYKNLMMNYNHFDLIDDNQVINRIQLKKMDSLMFTFSADQMSMQLGYGQKLNQSTLKSFKRRPSSSKTSHYEKSKMSSSNKNKLFENCQIQNKNIEQSPQKSFNNLKIKNSSIQIQQKRKLRNIIDNMLGKNFDVLNNNKLDSIVISNRKHINKHRGYLNGTRKMEQKQSSLHDKESKQNQFNLQNITIKSQHNIQQPVNDKKIKPSIKVKKFQFANIKITKMNNHSQRYPDLSKDYSQKETIQRKFVNIQRQSIDRQSIGKKVSRTKTPKIMYPQSDSKLPSVFRTHNIRSSLGDSLKKRPRILSAHFIADNCDKKTEDQILISKKKTLQNPPLLDLSIRHKLRPQSTMLESKRYSSSIERTQQNQNSQYYPKKLVFDCNQQLSEGISKKLGSNQNENKNMNLRMSTRAKSTHVNYVHRKLRQINAMIDETNFCGNQTKLYTKNQSHHSRQTAQASDFQDSTQRTLTNLSGKFTKTIEQKQCCILNSGLGCSITFQVHKQ